MNTVPCLTRGPPFTDVLNASYAYQELAVKNFSVEGLPVPESSSCAAALFGLGGLCLRRKRGIR